MPKVTVTEPLSHAERQRRYRERRVNQGCCVVCCVRKPAPGLTVCKQCNEEAKSRVYSSRGKEYQPVKKRAAAPKNATAKESATTTRRKKAS